MRQVDEDIQANSGQVPLAERGRETPERTLARNACVLCGCSLLHVKRDGCGALYADDRAACERDGWAAILGDHQIIHGDMSESAGIQLGGNHAR